MRTKLLVSLILSGALLLCTISGAASLLAFTITLESVSPYYRPAKATVIAGAPILWINPTASYHTVRHDGCVDGPRCAFDSGPVAPDGRFVLEGLPPGEYPYHCELHPIMRGMLVVTPPAPSSSTS